MTPGSTKLAVCLPRCECACDLRHLPQLLTTRQHSISFQMSAEEKQHVLSTTSLADRMPYFDISCCPITHEVEQRMEQISTVVSRENYNEHWQSGTYHCARCRHALYESGSKFVGPCMWPSFRSGLSGGLHTRTVPVGSYNEYTCEVREVYCGACRLFLGHQFDDGRACGDKHPDARWRHCVLSLSMIFEPSP